MDNENLNIKMFKFISKFIKLKFILILILAILYLIGGIIYNPWLILAFIEKSFYLLLLLSSFIAAKSALKYCELKNKKN